uniref:BEN domain-containing protein n=1 Tax=Timema bartmani TaxID=61472 RepID=A0A7R9F9F6_9NEOP|nr:unnamed protein product [Timema bartmani]
MFAHVKFTKDHQLKIVDVKEIEVLNGGDIKEKQICRVLKNGEYEKAIILRLGGENASFITSKNDVQIEPPLFEQVDDKIHLGSNVYVNAQAWHKVQLEKDPSKWVKSLAVVIWGSEELAKRSVKGGSRPPLTPLKLRVMKDRYEEFLEKRGYAGEAKSTFASRMNSFLGGKISDLQPHRFKKRSLSNN